MKEIREFKGIWIPAEIWLTKELSIQEKVLLIEIDSLDNEFGCIATNGYFAEFFGYTPQRISQIVSTLFELGYLHISYANDNKRTMKVTDKYKALKGGLNIFNSYKENVNSYKENVKTYKENVNSYKENVKTNSNPFSNSFNNTLSVCEENTHTQEISNENLNNQNSPLQKVAPKSFPKEILFQDSIYQDFEVFKTLCLELNVSATDCKNIYNKISLNSKSKNLLKNHWRAYIELWINNDVSSGLIYLRKAESFQSVKNDRSMLDEKQDEIIRKVRIIYKDFLEGVFNSESLLDSAIQGLRSYWKDANSFNRELITDVVSKMKNFKPESELEIIHKNTSQTIKKKPKGLGSRMKEKFHR